MCCAVALLAPAVLKLAKQFPIKADFSGGFRTLGAKVCACFFILCVCVAAFHCGSQGLPARELRMALLSKAGAFSCVMFFCLPEVE